jgi:hypothetical protein
MEREPHTYLALDSINKYAKIQILNLSAVKNYSMFEIMANTSGNKIARIYYCNSSYITGDPSTINSCTNFNDIIASTNFNHTHTSNSKHQLIPMAINITSGTIGTIKITPTSYFLIRGQPLTDAWNVYYITNNSRTGAIQTTDNGGTSWTNQTYTIDSHLHQYDGTSVFYYFVCANDSYQRACSSIRNDLIDLGSLPPNVFITSLISTTYLSNIIVSYLAISPNNFPIINYTIDLINLNFTQIRNLVPVTTSTTSTINSENISAGDYKLKVSARDNQNNLGIGYSENFNLTKATPPIALNSSSGWTILASTYSTISGLSCPAQLTCSLFEVYNNVTNPLTKLFPAGNYYFNFNTTGNTNYTNYDVYNTLISQVNGSVGIINGTVLSKCRYKKFGYYNDNLNYYKEVNCV